MIIERCIGCRDYCTALEPCELKYIVALLGHADHVGGVKALKLAVPGAQIPNQRSNELARGLLTQTRFMMMLQSQTVFSPRGDVLSVGTAQFKIWKLLVLLAVLFWWERELLLAFL